MAKGIYEGVGIKVNIIFTSEIVTTPKNFEILKTFIKQILYLHKYS
jgi:hypothetical protein